MRKCRRSKKHRELPGAGTEWLWWMVTTVVKSSSLRDQSYLPVQSLLHTSTGIISAPTLDVLMHVGSKAFRDTGHSSRGMGLPPATGSPVRAGGQPWKDLAAAPGLSSGSRGFTQPKGRSRGKTKAKQTGMHL